MNPAVRSFLDRLRAADAADQPMVVLSDDFEGWGAAVAEAPGELASIFRASAATGDAAIAEVRASSFASAACDRFGRAVVTADFPDWGPEIERAVRQAALALPHRPSLSIVAAGADDTLSAIAIGTAAASRRWPIAPAVRVALDAAPGRLALLRFRPEADGWAAAGTAYRLTPAEVGMLASLSRLGDLRAAARTRGVTYNTARKLLADALRKVGVNRHTELLSALIGFAAGEIGAPMNGERVFADLFNLSLRQAQLAQAVARGASREKAAAALGVSAHVAKAELKIVFLTCGATSAAGLTRIVTEVDALAGLATACDVEVAAEAGGREPLRLIRRRWASGRIAVADWGPSGGRPVVLFHTLTFGRHFSYRFISQLRTAGYRPIMFERAGFGLSDAAEGAPAQSATRDLAEVLDALDLASVLLLARGGAVAALTAAREMPDRIIGGVLLGPETPAALDRSFDGLIGRAKAMFMRQPKLIEAFGLMATRRTSVATIRRLMALSVRDSPADARALADPRNMADAVRATFQANLGLLGMVREIAGHMNGATPPALADGRRWTVIGGADDRVYPIDDGELFWRTVLPGCAIERIADGGRFLHLSDPERVIAALEEVTI